MAVVRFPDGTCVQAVGIARRDPDNPERDYGLYFSPRWYPTWPAEIVDWPDCGVPTDQVRAAGQIRSAFERARRGARVEIGCLAGLGRTGTALACMAILAGVAPRDAVAWVREHYHPYAVWGGPQEEWVSWCGAHWREAEAAARRAYGEDASAGSCPAGGGSARS